MSAIWKWIWSHFGPSWPWPIHSADWSQLTNATDTNCEGELHWKNLGEVILLCTAAFIFVLLCILKCTVKRSIWNLVIPVDLLISSPFRLVYCLILTLLAADVIQDVTNSSLYYLSPNNSVLDAAKLFGLTPLVIFPRQALIYLPVLCCVGFTIPYLGHALGFLYTLLMGCYSVYVEFVSLQGCSHRGQLSNIDVAISLLAKVPVYVGYVMVAAWFFYSTLHDIISLLCFGRKNRFEDSDVFCKYVQNLLQRHSPYIRCLRRLTKGSFLKFLVWGFQYVLPYNTGFKYPLSFLAPICMSSMVVYQLCVELVYRELKFLNNAMEFVESFNITIEELEKLVPPLKDSADSIFYDIKSFIEAMKVILPFGCLIGFGLSIFFELYLTQNFHKRLLRMARGDLNFLVTSEPLPSKPYILAAGMKYCAFQFGYLVFGWVIYNIMYSALQILGLVFYYLFKDFNLLGVRVWSFFMVPMMWGSVLHFVQLLLCRYVFMEQSSENNDFIGIRFKSLYHLLSYFFFFFNVLFGVVLSYLRVFASFMFTMVMYFRIDWDVYMRGLEGWDFGHRTYVGYMYLEYTLNNAVLRAFLHTLGQQSSPATRERKAEEVTTMSQDSLTSKLSGLRRRRARNMWFVGYTLIHNPQLRHLTAGQLNAVAS